MFVFLRENFRIYASATVGFLGNLVQRVSTPRGNFILHDDYSKPEIFLAGGIGVTPFRSLIKYAFDEQLPSALLLNETRAQSFLLRRTYTA